MFSSCMKESRSKQVTVEVADEHEAALTVTLVRFLYTGSLVRCDGTPCPEDDVLRLLFLADKLDVPSLLGTCVHTLTKTLTVDKCCTYLELPDALLTKCEDLITAARAFLLKELKVSVFLISLSFMHSLNNAGCGLGAILANLRVSGPQLSRCLYSPFQVFCLSLLFW